MKGLPPDSTQSGLLMQALVCHLFKSGGTCVVTQDELNDDKIVNVVEEDNKLTITVTLKRTGNTH